MVLVNIVFTLTALFMGKPFVLLHLSLMPASVCVAVRRALILATLGLD